MRKLTRTLLKVAFPQYAEHMHVQNWDPERMKTISKGSSTFTGLHKNKLNCPVCIIYFLEEFYICM